MSRRFRSPGKVFESVCTINAKDMFVDFHRLIEWVYGTGGVMCDSPQTYSVPLDDFDIIVHLKDGGKVCANSDLVFHVGIEEAREMWAGIKSGKLTCEMLKARHHKEELARWEEYKARLPELRRIWRKAEEDRKARELQEEEEFKKAVEGMWA